MISGLEQATLHDANNTVVFIIINIFLFSRNYVEWRILRVLGSCWKFFCLSLCMLVSTCIQQYTCIPSFKYLFLYMYCIVHTSTEIWFIQINTGKNTTCTTYIKKRSDSRIFDQKENGQNVSIFILLYLLWITTNKKTNHHVLGTTNCFSLPSCYSRCGHALCFTEKVFYVTEALTRWRVVHGRKVVVAVLYKCRMLSFVLMHLS